jgi:hypothetical protein
MIGGSRWGGKKVRRWNPVGYFNTIEDLGFFKNDRTDIRIFQTQHTRQVVAVEWSVVSASRRYSFAHNVKGHVLLALKRWKEAIPEYEAALASNHNLVAALQASPGASSTPGRLRK